MLKLWFESVALVDALPGGGMVFIIQYSAPGYNFHVSLSRSSLHGPKIVYRGSSEAFSIPLLVIEGIMNVFATHFFLDGQLPLVTVPFLIAAGKHL